MVEAFISLASDWLHYWQDLVGAGAGAVALLLTVGWTLASERRRNKREAAAFRTALGAEIRQLAAATLNNYAWLSERAAKALTAGSVEVYPTQLLHVTRLPEALIYSRGADKLGILGEQPAFDTAYFYGQLDLLRQSVQQIDAVAEPALDLTLRQVMAVMAGMLSAVNAAVEALPAFSDQAWAEKDAALAARCDGARRQFEVLDSARRDAEKRTAAAASRANREHHNRTVHMNYLFRGTVLIPHGQIKSEQVHVALSGGPDYPPGALRVAIRDNVVTAGFETPGTLTEVGIATLRNIVRDVATTLCRCFAVIEGTWARASVDSFTVEDGPQVLLNDIAVALKDEFENRDIKTADVIRVTEHPEGHYLRNAIDNIAVGLMEPKFARVQFHCAVEALRNSMAPDQKEARQWEIFRNTLQVTRAEIDTLVDKALRHGNYRDATPLSSAEKDAVLSFLGKVVCKYVTWFKSTKLSPPST